MAAIYCFSPLTNAWPSLQGHCRLVWREQGQRQHAAMEEEEPAALQPAVRGSEGAGDAGDGASQPGQPLAGKHWDPSPPLPPTSPPQSPALWHAEGRPALWGGFRRRWGTHLALTPTCFHLLSAWLLHPLCFRDISSSSFIFDDFSKIYSNNSRLFKNLLKMIQPWFTVSTMFQRSC